MPSPRSRTLGGPFELALAKAVPSVPMRAGTQYEPKWDGFRAVVCVGEGTAVIYSRNGTDLNARFPELLAAASEQVPDGCVLDGEAVVWGGDRLDFDALQRRMGAGAATARRLAAEQPASFVAFDVLAVLGRDVRGMPLSDRRRLLEELAAGFAPPLELSPATTDRAEAMRWWDELAPAGLEGLMAKDLAQPYRGGERGAWSKVKRREDTDAVCAAVIGPRSQPQQLVLGAWDTDGRLRFTGRTAPLTGAQANVAAGFLYPPAAEHPWPEEVPATALDRFARDRGPVHLTLVEPVVVEVSADAARSGVAFRHSVRLARFRPDLDPATVRATHS